MEEYNSPFKPCSHPQRLFCPPLNRRTQITLLEPLPFHYIPCRKLISEGTLNKQSKLSEPVQTSSDITPGCFAPADFLVSPGGSAGTNLAVTPALRLEGEGRAFSLTCQQGDPHLVRMTLLGEEVEQRKPKGQPGRRRHL
ncbi:unnamed protein product [Caretta caretta]